MPTTAPKGLLILFVLASLAWAPPASSESSSQASSQTSSQASADADASASTSLKVQVRSLDAKFIGSGVGELNVQISDVATGRVLDQGRITGPTGDTASMMNEGQTRGFTPSEPGSASWTGALAIDRPTLVAVQVTGPLAVAEAIQQQTTTLWMLPGVDRVDPPLILHLPGLIVERIAWNDEGQGPFTLTAAITMLCGCPITTDGLWRADDFQVTASFYRAGQKLNETTLEFTGRTNQFSGALARPEAGDYTLYISAYQHSSANTGVWHQAVPVR